MPAPRLVLRPVLAFLAVLAMAGSVSQVRVAADEPDPVATAEQAVTSAESDPGMIAAAKTAVDTAIRAKPDAVAPQVLLARLQVAKILSTKKVDEQKAANETAIAALDAAQKKDPRDVSAAKVRVALVQAMGGAKADLDEALRAYAIRVPGDKDAREAYRKSAGKPPVLHVGDPIPLVTWKTSAGDDVTVQSLYTDKPLVIEILRSLGGCEYCARRVIALHTRIKEFDAEHATVVATSSESGEVLAGFEKNGIKKVKPPISVRLFSDKDGGQADLLCVLNPDSTKQGVPAAERNVAYPTTIVVDTKGMIRFIETNQKYAQRASIDYVLGAVKQTTSEIGVGVGPK